MALEEEEFLELNPYRSYVIKINGSCCAYLLKKLEVCLSVLTVFLR